MADKKGITFDMLQAVTQQANRQASKEKVELLMKQYNRLLVDKGLALSKKKVRSLDTIDIRPAIQNYSKDSIGSDTGIPDNESILWMTEQVLHMKENWAKQNNLPCQKLSFFDLIPCFEEGVFYVNRNRWMYFKIEKLLLNQEGDLHNICEVYIRDYMFATTTGWEPCINCILRIEEGTGKKPTCFATHYTLFQEIYRTFDDNTLKKELGWNDSDIAFWKNTIVKHSDEAEGRMQDKNGVCQEVKSIIILYSTFVRYTNAMLLSNKPSHGRRSRPAKSKAAKTVFDKEAEQPVQLTRTVGENNHAITVTSRKPPKSASMEYVRHYKVACWKACAHTRTYKSGKTVYIRESIRHRKGLEEKNEQKAPQSVLYIKPKKRKDDEI